MPLAHIVVGRRSFLDQKIPDDCSVREWKELLRQGRASGGGVHGARRLVCFADGGSRVLTEDDPLPLAPEEVIVEGPTTVLGALTMALAGGTANHKAPATPRKQQKSPRRTFFLSGLIKSSRSRRANMTSDDTTSNHDRASAEAILEFWFEELSEEHWFRLSHLIDDRIWREFGALHRRAAAGELAGWKARPETCLALVVMLDQFSRRLYRGTAAAYACDGLAREAASTALIRGDDHYHWPAGPRRCALYLPFVHVDDIADKKRLFAALGARDDSYMTRGSAEDLQRLLGVAASALGPQGSVTVPDKDGGQDDTFPLVEEEVQLSASGSGGGLSDGSSIVLPQLCSAGAVPGRRRLSAFVYDQEIGSFSDLSSSVVEAEESSRAIESTILLSSDSGASFAAGEVPPPRQETSGSAASVGAAASASGAGARPASAGPRVGPSSPPQQSRTQRPSSPRQPASARRPCGGQALSKEIAGSYPAQAALELPKIQALMLNHEFGRRFRAMKLDKKTQQAYDRDKQAPNVTTRYLCLVCNGRHDFRLEGCCHGGR